ncbi:hypothetical protein TSUD_258420 [Trifolium subterraneum]|uniref:RST domain-containing protein n=1 Tax=Trifolium subterraneum TaxID=3900 RepID=A0A2Z6P879_TRISU|nr:hypothetical protein TSUD_258420 [Trifolium subterraneum]
MDPSKVQQEMSNLQVTVNEQPQIEINSSIPVMPYDRLFSILIHDHPDKAYELKVLFNKCKRDEIPKNTIDLLLKDILGEELFLSASKKMQQKRSLPVTSSLHTVPYDRIFPIFFHDYPDQANELQVLFDKCKRDEISRNTFVSLLLDILGDHRQIRRPLVPYDQMFPFLFPEIQQDKANKVQALFDKYKKGEIHRNNFYARMKKIVGEELLSSASKKMCDHQLQKRNLPVTVNEQSRTQISFSLPVVPYDHMFPFLFPEIPKDKANEILALFDKYKVNEHTQISFRLPVVSYDKMFPFLFPEINKDKANEIQALFDKYKRSEMPKYDFLFLMKDIAGEEKLRSVEITMERNRLVLVNEQTRTQINSREEKLTFDQLFGVLISIIRREKRIELQASFDKYKRGEIAKHTFVPIMKGILGDQYLRSITAIAKQQKKNLLVPVNEQPRTQIISSELPFEQLFPFLISHLDPDKAIELEAFFDKYKALQRGGDGFSPPRTLTQSTQVFPVKAGRRGEIPQHTFEADMKGILGEQVLRLVIAKMKRQVENNQRRFFGHISSKSLNAAAT